MKKIAILILVGLYMVSCNTDDDDVNESKLSYYQFSESDRELIIDYDYLEGDVLKYKNQDNETLEFRVTEVVEGKVGEYSRSGFLESHHDRKMITLEIYEAGATDVCSGRVTYIFSKSSNRLKIGFYFSLWNKSATTLIELSEQTIVHQTIRHPYERLYQIMTVNGITYDKVMQFESGTAAPYNYYSDLEIYVNEALYDMNFGIVQFKDIEENIWNLSND